MEIRLVVFDVDGTLTQHSSIWWRLHELFDTTEAGRVYFDQYFAGEIDYQQWSDLDAALWTGKPLSAVLKAVNDTKLVSGAREVIQALKDRGIKTAILSGGLDIMAESIAKRVGIDFVLTNRLLHSDGKLTGSVENIVGWADKADHIHIILEYFDVSLDETAFVGDGRNDLSVFSIVGLSIAFNPKEDEVAKAADVVIRENDLRAILNHII